MVTKIRDYPRYPDDDLSQKTGPQLKLSLSRLLELTHLLKQAESTIEIRLRVVRFKDQLEFAAPENPSDTVELAPNYLRDVFRQIEQAHTLERARYYVERLEKALTQVKTSSINDINLNRWKEYQDIYTDSLWVVPRRDRTGVHKADYWGNFIPQIPNQLLKRYTKQGELVLDTFVGSGTTLVESQRLGRHGIGIELQPEIAQLATERIAGEANPAGVTNQVVCADSLTVDYRNLLEQFGAKAFQLVVMHPPYHDIIRFSTDEADLSNAPSLEDFLEKMGQLVSRVAPVLERGRYLALVIGDKFTRGEWVPLGFMAMNEVQKQGFSLKSIVVKNFEDTSGKRSQQELWKYRALVGGFYIFKHEYIFLFKKK